VFAGSCFNLKVEDKLNVTQQQNWILPLVFKELPAAKYHQEKE